MQQAEIQLGLRIEAQLLQRCEVLRLGPVRNGHVDPVQGPVESGRERVGDLDELARVRRHDEVPVVVVAVAEMEAELDVRRHAAADAQQALEHAGAGAFEPCGADALEDRELQPRVPLQRELVVRHRGKDPLELA
jgi:hypothetical protein